MLVNKKGLAKTSASPGKTQTINHFLINEEKHPWYLVDLPGYGYAKANKQIVYSWNDLIINYLKTKYEKDTFSFTSNDYQHRDSYWRTWR
jgi:GTP-binding protein